MAMSIRKSRILVINLIIQPQYRVILILVFTGIIRFIQRENK